MTQEIWKFAEVSKHHYFKAIDSTLGTCTSCMHHMRIRMLPSRNGAKFQIWKWHNLYRLHGLHGENIWSTFTNVYSILTTWENECPYSSKNKIWKPWKHRFVVPTVGRHNIRTVALNLDCFVIWVATSPLSLSLSKGTCIERSKSSNILVTKRTRDPTHRVWKNLHGWHSKLIFLQKKVEHLVWVASSVQWGRWLRLSYCTSFASQGITQDNKVIHVQICLYLRGLGTIVGIYLGPINRTDPNNSIIHSPVCLHIYSTWFCMFFAVVHHVITMCVRLRPTFWARFSWKRQRKTRGHSKIACCSMLSSSFLFFRNIDIIPSSRPVLIWNKKINILIILLFFWKYQIISICTFKKI